MSLSKKAIEKHEELFPGLQSPMRLTDPEIVEIFGNFAFDEVIINEKIDVKTRIIAILASLIAQQTLTQYRVMVAGALHVGVTPVALKEMIYQAVPILGMPKVLDFIHATNEVFRSQGIELPLEPQSKINSETRLEKGSEILESVFGKTLDDMYAEYPEDMQHIQKMKVTYCLGDFYTRNGLDVKMRELCTFVFLAALGDCEPQLVNHIKSNIMVDNDRETLIAVVTQIIPYIGFPRGLTVLRILNEII